MPGFKACLYQGPNEFDSSKHLQVMVEQVRLAVAQKADLVMFPECFAQGTVAATHIPGLLSF